MMYIKFSSKDTTAIINATDKLINCNPTKSAKVKSIPPELRELCSIVRGQLRSMGYMEYRVEYLRPLIEVMNLFGSFFNSQLLVTFKELYHYIILMLLVPSLYAIRQSKEIV